MREFLLTFIRGAVIGVANIIPGVSGGTMALILGVYDRCLAAISAIKPATFKRLLNRKTAVEEIKRIDLPFLIILAFGAGVAILALAKVMTLLLNFFHDPTYGFFFGLILASVLVPWKLVKKTTATVVIMTVIGVGAGVGCDFLMSNQKKIANAEHKIAISLLKDQKKLPENVNNPQKLQEIDSQIAAMGSGQESAGYYLELVGAGALAISAMILPGISGSFLLLAMGLYFDILAALSNFNIPVILVFGLGCLLGLLLFSHLLSWLLKRCADQTMGFLTGLMAGSLWTIWPFRTAQIVGEATPYEQLVYLGNRLPASFGTNEIITILTTLAGIAVVAFFLGYEKKHAAAAAKSA